LLRVALRPAFTRGLKGIIMAIEINITNRERIFINPLTGERIPRIQKGLYTVEQIGKLDASGETPTTNGETQEVENI